MKGEIRDRSAIILMVNLKNLLRLEYNSGFLPPGKNFSASMLNAVILFLSLVMGSCHSPAPVHFNNMGLKNVTGGKTNLSQLISASQWNELFPNRYGLASSGVNAADSGKDDFYTFNAFESAAKKFPAFLGEKNDTLQRRELAAFLAHIAQETTGGWPAAPGGYQTWGLYFKDEQGCQGGCPAYSISSNSQFPPTPGQSYQGRGPMQLSYNYQYGLFSLAYFGDKQVLLDHPDLLDQDSVLAFASAIWFWMTPQANKPSCHEVMDGEWKPNLRDSLAGRKPGFGTTLNIINGGVECGHPPLGKTLMRYQEYQYFCHFLRVSAGMNLDCTYQIPFSSDTPK
ncbi:MAG: chitinase [Chitinophagaceae bacterium]